MTASFTEKSANQARRPLWRSFFRDQRGSLLAWGAFLIIPILGFVGIAMDSSRGYIVKARLVQALDAAALAAGKVMANESIATADAIKYFNVNLPAGYMDSTVTSGPTVTFNQAAGWVQVTATVQMPTYLGHFLGVNSFTMSGLTEVAKKTVWTDIVMTVDVSGSMSSSVGGVVKIDAARTAATTMVESMFGADATKTLLKMGLITWSGNARILPLGTTFDSATQTTAAVTSYANPYRTGGSWPSVNTSGCSSCSSIYSGLPTTVTTHYFYHGVPIPLMKAAPAGWKGCVLERLIDNNAPDDGDTILGVGDAGTKHWHGYIPLGTNSQCTNQGIRRLTNVKATIQAAVDQLTSPTGNTNMAMGLGMGWRLLGMTGSPFAGDGTPNPPPGEEIIRALVVMTDGENTSTNTDAYNGKLTAAEMDARALAVATAIKASGVVIYAIQFEFNTGPLVAQMKLIASGSGSPYYQYAPNAAALQTAFAEIAAHLTKLRLTK